MQKNRTYIRLPDTPIERFMDHVIESSNVRKNTIRHRSKHCVTAYSNRVGGVVCTRVIGFSRQRRKRSRGDAEIILRAQNANNAMMYGP